MPIQLAAKIRQESDEKLRCTYCNSEIRGEERYVYWTIRGDDPTEYIRCSWHTDPTNLDVALSVLDAYGYGGWKVGNLVRVNRVRYEKILNPATPSFFTMEDMMRLIQEPLLSVIKELVKLRCVPNPYMKAEADLELQEEALIGVEGRKYHVLKKDRKCENCGVSEAETIKQNPKYTFCRGVCPYCYRRLFRKKVSKKGTGLKGDEDVTESQDNNGPSDSSRGTSSQMS